MFKEELWARQTIVEIIMLKRCKTMEDSDLLEEIQRNDTRKHEVEQEPKKENSLVWEQDRIIYMDRQIYILNNKKIKE